MYNNSTLFRITELGLKALQITTSNISKDVTNKVSKLHRDISFTSAPTINIQGNIDNNTLNTLSKQEERMYNKFKNKFMMEILREKNNG